MILTKSLAGANVGTYSLEPNWKREMRNVFYIAATLVIAIAIFTGLQPQQEPLPAELHIDHAETPIKANVEGSIDDWVIKPSVHLISTPADGWGETATDAEDSAIVGSISAVASQVTETRDLIGTVESKVTEASTRFTAATFSLEQRLDELERRMGESESDIDDLETGQADLTKRVEELTALIEVRTSSGEVKTKAVAVGPGGSQFLLAPGEIITHIDGVAVAPVRVASGGSNGSFTQSTATTTSTAQYGSPPVSTTSGGSNGSLQYNTQSYQTQSYNVSSQPVGANTQVQIAPRRPLQQLRSNGPLRSRFAPQTSAPQCVGPNCPN